MGYKNRCCRYSDEKTGKFFFIIYFDVDIKNFLDGKFFKNSKLI